MSEKSVQKRQFILETAKKVFTEKGYKNVTMKDIVDACQISRGGLYLYFESTKELFLEVLTLESKETDDVFSKSISENADVTEILALFLKEQKKELLLKKQNLNTAKYEFLFENSKEKFLKKQFNDAVQILNHLLKIGMENGEFYEVDAMRTARNIMFVLEGLKISSLTLGITEAIVDAEILYIMEGLIVDFGE